MNFYILLFLTAFFASMTILTTMKIVNGHSVPYEEDVIGVLDNECRENYHDWCLGDKWSKLVEQNPMCETFEDGSTGCIGDRVFDYDIYIETGKKVYCTVVTLEGDDKCNMEGRD